MRTEPRDSSAGFLVVPLLCALLLAGCTSGPAPVIPGPTSFGGPPATLRVLAGSELEDMKPILAEAAKATGVTVKLTEMGTLDGAHLVADGKADGAYDATWFSSNRYADLQAGTTRRLGTSTSIMYSPVLLGLRASVANRLGWSHSAVNWQDIADAAGEHEFTFGMTDPADSNSGFSALVGIATAVADTGAALTGADTVDAASKLRGFFSAQALSSGSSGWLSDAYRRRAASADARQTVDGIINYESVLLSLNASHTLPEPLTPVYPTDGVVLADYPLTLLSSASAQAKSAYTRLAGYLRTPSVQREIMDRTYRRPVLSSVPLSHAFGSHRFYELPFPGTTNVVNDLLGAYFDTLRRPARTVYVLDTSGSMAGDRIAGLKTALAALTGASPSLVSQFDQFHDREQITMLPFSTAPGNPTTFDVPAADPQRVDNQIKTYIDELHATGNTAIYDSLVTAYTVLGHQAATDPDRITSIVLLTDGENNTGRNPQAFTTFLHQLPAAAASVPIFPILFGEADEAQMRSLARLTGGMTFDGRTQSLTEVFKDIRGYQ